MPGNIAEVRNAFRERGISVSEWARGRGFSLPLVYRVLSGRPAHRGQSHEIAVALGLKQGRPPDIAELEVVFGDFRRDVGPVV